MNVRSRKSSLYNSRFRRLTPTVRLLYSVFRVKDGAPVAEKVTLEAAEELQAQAIRRKQARLDIRPA